jgi:spoIIIJ-associated protein
VTDTTSDEPVTVPTDSAATEVSSTDSASTDSASTDAASTDAASGATTGTSAPKRDRAAELENEGDIAADYLEGLLDIADFDGDIDMDVEGDRAMVSIVGADLSDLVGDRGQVLDALQELTRLAVLRETGDRSRLMLDISGFRAQRRADLTEVGAKAAEEAKSSGEPVKLAPMSAFERKVVHDAIAAAGLQSESEGEEPRRCVVVLPS